MRLGERTGDEEPEAGARLGAAGGSAPELLEDLRLVLRRDAGPSSRTRTTTWPSSARARTLTSAPRSEYLTAFEIRLSISWRSRSASPRTCGQRCRQLGRDAHLVLRRSPRRRPSRARSRRGRRPRSCSRKSPPRCATCRARPRPAPRAGSSRRAITARNASRCSGRSSRHRCCSVRAEPITAAIGLRSSCETSETKSARSADRRRSSSTVARSAS